MAVQETLYFLSKEIFRLRFLSRKSELCLSKIFFQDLTLTQPRFSKSSFPFHSAAYCNNHHHYWQFPAKNLQVLYLAMHRFVMPMCLMRLCPISCLPFPGRKPSPTCPLCYSLSTFIKQALGLAYLTTPASSGDLSLPSPLAAVSWAWLICSFTGWMSGWLMCFLGCCWLLSHLCPVSLGRQAGPVPFSKPETRLSVSRKGRKIFFFSFLSIEDKARGRLYSVFISAAAMMSCFLLLT